MQTQHNFIVNTQTWTLPALASAGIGVRGGSPHGLKIFRASASC